jgi:acyl carrier protein
MINYTETVIQFVSKYWSVSANNLSKDTRLEDDLGITGDDAVELFDKFSKEFHIDISDLDLRKYFESEGVGLINFSRIFGKQIKVKRSLHEITISDLVNTLKIGKWIDPI